MRILLLTHAFNSLTQRLFVELKQDGHEISVEFDVHDDVSIEAVDLFCPDLIVAPYLKRAIPPEIWRKHVCLIVHPGIPGDRGPSSLDWAILNQETNWGVTVLQANEEMDAGDIWASVGFPMRDATKSSLYRNEVADAAVQAVKLAIERFSEGKYRPLAQHKLDADAHGICRPLMGQEHRAIDWQKDDTQTVLRKIRCADGFPGIRDEMFGRQMFLCDAHPAEGLSGEAGTIIARSGPAVCRATCDGAVWIGHVKDKQHRHPFKLPTSRVLAEEVDSLPEISDGASAYRDIFYQRRGHVGYLHFPFYNGAMGSEQCQRLLTAYRQAVAQDTRVIVLMGGPDFWSNGMHLNLIEASPSPADESWKNINAMDDLAEAIICTDSQLTVASMRGNAGAGGVFLARATDRVWLHRSVILNPHYKDMGNLYGSEYWSYLLPCYTGAASANMIARARLPMDAVEALSLGLADEVFDGEKSKLSERIDRQAQMLADDACWQQLLAEKNSRREADERQKPLAEYRKEELAQMHRNFYGFDPSYHVARYNFVYKVCKSRTPLTLASHRRSQQQHISRRAA